MKRNEDPRGRGRRVASAIALSWCIGLGHCLPHLADWMLPGDGAPVIQVVIEQEV